MTTTTASVSSAKSPKAAAAASSEAPGRRFTVGKALAWAAMILIMLFTLLPFYWVLRTALSSNAGITAHPTSLLPVDINLRGFARVFGMQSTEEALADGGSGAAINFWLYLRNSVIISTLVTVGQVFFSAMAAYSFSRLRWRGRDTVFAVFLGALMVPSIFTLLPNFVLVKQLHLIDTFLGVALPTMFMTPFAVFFLKQFFMNIPRELEEAALLDGASKVRVFFTLILPMAKAPISTLAILTYITAWNDYFWPLLVSYTDSSRVLTVALAVFRSQAPQTGPDWAGLWPSSAPRPLRPVPTGPGSWPPRSWPPSRCSCCSWPSPGASSTPSALPESSEAPDDDSTDQPSSLLTVAPRPPVRPGLGSGRTDPGRLLRRFQEVGSRRRRVLDVGRQPAARL